MSPALAAGSEIDSTLDLPANTHKFKGGKFMLQRETGYVW